MNSMSDCNIGDFHHSAVDPLSGSCRTHAKHGNLRRELMWLTLSCKRQVCFLKIYNALKGHSSSFSCRMIQEMPSEQRSELSFKVLFVMHLVFNSTTPPTQSTTAARVGGR